MNMPAISVFNKLIDQLKSPDSGVRNAAVIELGVMQNPAAILPLLSRLNDPNETVRLFSVRALRNILRADQEMRELVAESLLESLADPYEPVRRAVAFTLSDLRYEDAMPFLVALFEHASPGMSLDLLYVIVEIGGIEALGSVVEVLPRKPQALRETIESALKEIGYNPATE